MFLEGQSVNIFSTSVLNKTSAVVILKQLTMAKEKELVIVKGKIRTETSF